MYFFCCLSFLRFAQDYSRLWVEVNYTVSAYDELKMCKSRTQAVDPIELKDKSVMESNLIISKYEVSIQNEHTDNHSPSSFAYVYE